VQILRSGSEINGMTTSHLLGVIYDDHLALVKHGYLWADENGRTLLDSRGYEWLRENPLPVVEVNAKQRAALELIRDNPRRVRQHTLYGKVDPIEADMLPLHENVAYSLRKKGLISKVVLGTGKQVKIYGQIETMDFVAYELTIEGERALGMYGADSEQNAS
jgi:hypothetical protein